MIMCKYLSSRNKLGSTDSKACLAFGQMNEPPGARQRIALTGLSLAEYFRDEMNQDVLFFVDNIFRYFYLFPFLASKSTIASTSTTFLRH